jgi:hypothetical protein
MLMEMAAAPKAQECYSRSRKKEKRRDMQRRTRGNASLRHLLQTPSSRRAPCRQVPRLCVVGPVRCLNDAIRTDSIVDQNRSFVGVVTHRYVGGITVSFMRFIAASLP